MLQGFEKNKLTAPFMDTEHRVPSEDLLTAATFGMIAYVEPQMASRMLSAILGGYVKLQSDPTRVEVDLWPKNVDGDGRGWIEPDAIIDIFIAREPVPTRLIIEAKWNAPLGGQQAIEQWRRCRSVEGETWHVFPVRSAAQIRAQLEAEEASAEATLGGEGYSTWKAHRCCISWFEISGRLTREALGSDRMARWARGLVSVLKFLGEKPFEGFARLRAPMSSTSNSPLFWRGAEVGRRFKWPTPFLLKPLKPIFFAASIQNSGDRHV